MKNSFAISRAVAGVIDALLPIAAVLLAFLVGVFLLLALGADPFAAYYALINGALGNVSGITQALTKATPLLLVGVGICIAFRGGVINIGGEGQIIVGAIGATAFSLALRDAPGWLLLPLTLIVGALAGALWGGIAGLLKARLGVNEILSTVMLNQIALQLMNLLLRGVMLDPKQVAAGTNIPQSEALPEQVWLLRLVVVGAVVPGRVGIDCLASYFAEGDQHRAVMRRGGDRNGGACACWMVGGPLQHLHAPHRAAGHTEQAVNFQVVEQPDLRPHHVADRHNGEVEPVGFAGFGVDAGGSGRPVT